MISSTSLSKVSNFRIVLPTTQKTIEFFCVETMLPGITIGTIENKFMSMQDYRPGDSLTYNPLTLTVLCDQALETYKEVFSILNATHDPFTNKLSVSQEIFDGYLMLTSNKNNIIHKIHFYDCFITDISDINFQTTSGEDPNYSFTLGLRFCQMSFD